ncbi:MAG: NUDIX hydrolase [Bacteriovoracia bacterium]
MSFNESHLKLVDALSDSDIEPQKGLPEEIFLLVSRLTPMINVDLLIKNKENETLLTWREDQFYKGWHIPGGIIRFKEKMGSRVEAVAKTELGASVTFDNTPMMIREIFAEKRDIRGHFISLLFRCKLTSDLAEELRCTDPERPGPNQWFWHKKRPATLIEQHLEYAPFIDSDDF